MLVSGGFLRLVLQSVVTEIVGYIFAVDIRKLRLSRLSNDVLGICDRNSNFIEANRVENFECISHVHKVSGIVDIQKGFAKFRGLSLPLAVP